MKIYRTESGCLVAVRSGLNKARNRALLLHGKNDLRRLQFRVWALTLSVGFLATISWICALATDYQQVIFSIIIFLYSLAALLKTRFIDSGFTIKCFTEKTSRLVAGGNLSDRVHATILLISGVAIISANLYSFN